jgi:hypothetical protein
MLLVLGGGLIFDDLLHYRKCYDYGYKDLIAEVSTVISFSEKGTGFSEG